MVLFDALFTAILQIISASGYFGVFFLMVLESMVFPVPSEAVMPFAGFLVATGEFDLVLVAIASTLGSIVGSLISYYIGFRFGKPFFVRYGKYFLLDKKHLEKTQKFFKKRGEITIFIARFIPVIRHIISIPAGIGKMNLKKFIIFTTIGAAMWNLILTYAGILLKENWEIIMSYTIYLDMLVIIAFVILIIFFVRGRTKK